MKPFEVDAEIGGREESVYDAHDDKGPPSYRRFEDPVRAIISEIEEILGEWVYEIKDPEHYSGNPGEDHLKAVALIEDMDADHHIEGI